jgi:L-asparaginase II
MNEVPDPVLVEVTRGGIVESGHRGALAIADADGNLVLALGDVSRPVYPRSAVKIFQALPLIESGAADAFGLGDRELAVACASHGGEAMHLQAARAILDKAGIGEEMLACGAHWPLSERGVREIVLAGGRPLPIHNNCSGKHAGMLAAARHLGLDPHGYEKPEHPLQRRIARDLGEACGFEADAGEMGIDGCSVPTFAFPLAALATGFARAGSGRGLPGDKAKALRRLIAACFAKPALMAGEGRFDTIALRGLAPRVFCKGGAEGVHAAALSELGLGIAVKIDDGAKRGAEIVLAHVLASMVPDAGRILSAQIRGEIATWKGRKVGELRPSAELKAALDRMQALAGTGSQQSKLA